MTNINSLEKVLQKLKDIHGDTYIYEKVIYIGYHSNVIIICKLHGEFQQTPANHAAGKGCNKCASLKKAQKFKTTLGHFKEKSNKEHDFKYDYSLIEDIINSDTKVPIICPNHGTFWQRPGSHMKGFGCQRCAMEAIASTKKLTKEIFIERSNLIHDSFYDYCFVIYINNNTKVQIVCPLHGSFWQMPANHLNNEGCPSCAKIRVANFHRSNTQEFIEKSNPIFENLYDYSLVDYINDFTKVIIICKNHGSFEKTPSHHLQRQGCPLCNQTVSNIEIKWLDLLEIPKEFRQAYLKIRDYIIKPDAYNPNTKTIYEFYGDYWHGNPDVFDPHKINPSNKKTFGELYKRTLLKEAIILGDGYNLVSIWEADFVQKYGR